ncbi:MAG: heavy-metal-associated domain-containing protein [Paludibacteraceae bacterium]|nr:heavy-metal-associated domain-containing protein [Paludibacteraceae bacterium]
MKRLLFLSLFGLLAFFVEAAPKHQRDTVVYEVEIHCQGCVDKIQKNIAFEKGLKDMKIDKDKQTVWLVFDPTKTTDEKLREAFAKIGKPVKRVVKK